MIQENKIKKNSEVVITPKDFVKKTKPIADVPSYNWDTQQGFAMTVGTYRQTFTNPSTWENDSGTYRQTFTNPSTWENDSGTCYQTFTNPSTWENDSGTCYQTFTNPSTWEND